MANKQKVRINGTWWALVAVLLLVAVYNVGAATGWLPTDGTILEPGLSKVPSRVVPCYDQGDGTCSTTAAPPASSLPSDAATATNQTSQLSAERSFAINLGDDGDSSATTDTGTFSLIALVKRSLTHMTRLWQGPNASCAHRRGSGVTVVNANSSGTTVDAGATGTGYWTVATNLGKTFAIVINEDTGTTPIPPLTSYTISTPGAATPDSVVFRNDCAICSNAAATYVAVTTCDDD